MVRLHPTASETNTLDDCPPSADELELRINDLARGLAAFARNPCQHDQEPTFKVFEQALIPMVFAIARVTIALFLTCAEERQRGKTTSWIIHQGRTFQRKSPTDRTITTWFGPVRYWRTHMMETGKKGGRGFFPLDLVLGLTSDRFGFSVLAITVRLATMLSFATAKTTAELFLPEVPSKEVIEQATVGFGRFTARWFEAAPPPENDGDVLVILFDGKGTPQATEEELALRRQPWKDRPRASSPRHRGRQRRDRRTKKKRRAKDDKSKNARVATMVVMYTLKTVGSELHGPLNKWFYASFAPKKHAFAIAWREAKKRGFDPESDDVIQIVTDGDDDLSRYAKLFFPNALHTLDIMHVIERLWSASKAIHEAGSEAQAQWIEEQKDRLYRGEIKEVIAELRTRRRGLCRSKKNEKQREKLKEHIGYLSKRVAMMNYAELIDEDLEIGSGAVEGAVKYVICKRCDQGGMRWIVERNEAVVQLRCIEVNGDWEAFTTFVHGLIFKEQCSGLTPTRLQQKAPEALPGLMEPEEWKAAA